MTTLSQHKNFEYRSKQDITGLPLIHINIGTNPETRQPLIAKGVVAIGNIAVGVVAIGAAAFGVVALGAFGLGVVSLACLSIGIIAFGPIALGYTFALGVLAISTEYALGLFGFGSIVFELQSLISLKIERLTSLLLNM